MLCQCGSAGRAGRLGGGVDEIPTFQVLEREPIRRAIPGSVEQQEFDYTRHGTVNVLVFLVVHSGLMELAFLASNDAGHFLSELELFRRHHRELRGVYLIQDNGPSHVAGGTRSYFAGSQGWWKPRNTPANASWLNQAEILIHAFCITTSRGLLKYQAEFRPMSGLWPEYNHCWRPPFECPGPTTRCQWFAKRP